MEIPVKTEVHFRSASLGDTRITKTREIGCTSLDLHRRHAFSLLLVAFTSAQVCRMQ